jgi:hypothetical protein
MCFKDRIINKMDTNIWKIPLFCVCWSRATSQSWSFLWKWGCQTYFLSYVITLGLSTKLLASPSTMSISFAPNFSTFFHLFRSAKNVSAQELYFPYFLSHLPSYLSTMTCLTWPIFSADNWLKLSKRWVCWLWYSWSYQIDLACSSKDFHFVWNLGTSWRDDALAVKISTWFFLALFWNNLQALPLVS